jgi:hypothetical protein
MTRLRQPHIDRFDIAAGTNDTPAARPINAQQKMGPRTSGTPRHKSCSRSCGQIIPSIDAIIRQLVAAAMPQHVRVDLHVEGRCAGGAFHHGPAHCAR